MHHAKLNWLPPVVHARPVIHVDLVAAQSW